jgi:hypothetical protein
MKIMFRGYEIDVEWASDGTRTIMLRPAEPGPEFKSGIATETEKVPPIEHSAWYSDVIGF